MAVPLLYPLYKHVYFGKAITHSLQHLGSALDQPSLKYLPEKPKPQKPHQQKNNGIEEDSNLK